MLGIVLCGIGCMVFTFVQNCLMNRSRTQLRTTKDGQRIIAWKNRHEIGKLSKGPMRKVNVYNGFIGCDECDEVKARTIIESQSLV